MVRLRHRVGVLAGLLFLAPAVQRCGPQRVTSRPLRTLVGLVLLVLLVGSQLAAAQVEGDRVLLVERALGIPGHPAAGNNAVSHRFPGGTTVTITAIDSATGWFRVDDGVGHVAWITRTYIAFAVPAITPPAPTGECYEVGLWNLEHFGKGKSRGFPEYTYNPNGPTYPPRAPSDLAAIATAIRDVIKARVIVLTEINGRPLYEDEDAGVPATSEEMDDLATRLGPSFRYVLARSGGAQRVGILYDTRYARLNAWEELEVPNPKIQGKGLFDRRPLMGHFTFLRDGQTYNDLLIVGLHLASGQQLTSNHDQAMAMVITKLDEARLAGNVLPAGEYDMLIVGDLNASWFDSYQEQFFDQLNNGDWRVLARDPYPATRLAGEPLSPKSQIDYLIASRHLPGKRGLFGQEIMAEQATVHQQLAEGDWYYFRRVFSDHFPVTTCVAVIVDDD